MIALADFSIILLGTSALVLGLSTMLMSVTMPTLSWRRRQRHSTRRGAPIQATHRRAGSGRPSPLSSMALPPAPDSAGQRATADVTGRPHRQMATAQDTRHTDAVSEAEATIGYFLDADPERIARLMMNWINEGTPHHVVDGRA